MKILHTADWHLGKQLNNFSLLDDQRHALLQLLELIKAEKPDVVLLAGDIYDRAVPPAEAIALFGQIVNHIIIELKTPLMAIAGNHDNAERIEYGSQLFEKQHFYIEGFAKFPLKPIVLKDEFGEVNFYLFPYTEPENLRFLLSKHQPEKAEAIHTHEDVFKWLVTEIEAVHSPSDRTVIVAHAFVRGGNESESERALVIGGAGDVPANIFQSITYTAFGHLHEPQNFLEGKVRYSGSLLKYSISEAKHRKSFSIIELDKNGINEIREIEISPLRDVCKVEGKIEKGKLLLSENQLIPNNQDFVQVYLLNDEVVANAMAIVQENFPNAIGLQWINLTETLSTRSISAEKVRTMSEEDLCIRFYEDFSGKEIDEAKKLIINSIIKEIKQTI